MFGTDSSQMQWRVVTYHMHDRQHYQRACVCRVPGSREWEGVRDTPPGACLESFYRVPSSRREGLGNLKKFGRTSTVAGIKIQHQTYRVCRTEGMGVRWQSEKELTSMVDVRVGHVRRFSQQSSSSLLSRGGCTGALQKLLAHGCGNPGKYGTRSVLVRKGA